MLPPVSEAVAVRVVGVPAVTLVGFALNAVMTGVSAPPVIVSVVVCVLVLPAGSTPTAYTVYVPAARPAVDTLLSVQVLPLWVPLPSRRSLSVWRPDVPLVSR